MLLYPVYIRDRIKVSREKWWYPQFPSFPISLLLESDNIQGDPLVSLVEENAATMYPSSFLSLKPFQGHSYSMHPYCKKRNNSQSDSSIGFFGIFWFSPLFNIFPFNFLIFRRKFYAKDREQSKMWIVKIDFFENEFK